MFRHKKRRMNASFKDVQIAYLSKGIDSVEKMYNERLVSPNTIQRAISGLKTSGLSIDTFEKWFNENFFFNKVPHSSPYKKSKILKAQKIKNNFIFIRLPLKELQINKGGLVSAKFLKDSIIIKAL